MRFPKKLSVVIPVFNEASRLSKALKVCNRFRAKFPGWEFIWVNDGSTDKSEQMIKRSGFEVVSYKPNQGKGYALKQGVSRATKSLVLVCDVDFSTPLTEIPKFYAATQTGAEMVIGSRRVRGAKIIKHQPRLREWLGARFTDLSNLWLGLKVTDFTCGFKLFKKEVAKKIFKRQRIKRWGYDSEIVFIAYKLKIKIKEVPVVWRNDERTRVLLGVDIFRSFLDLILIRWYSLIGRY